MHNINKPIRKLALVPPFLFLLLFAACKKETPVQPDVQVEPPALDLPEVLNTDVLVPLTVGNWWKYERATYRLSSEEITRKDSSLWRIISDTTLTYGDQRRTAAISGYETSDLKWFETNGDDGFLNLGGISEEDTLVTQFLERKYPAAAGESWQVPRLAFSTTRKEFYFSDTLIVTCLAIDQDFETPAGTFQCYVYQFVTPLDGALGKREHFVYFTPGIGRVGWIERSLGSENLLYKTALYDARVR